MKKFFNFYSAVMLLIFIVGLVLAAVSQNWTTFAWIITGILWFLMARFHETSEQDLIEEHEGKIAELRNVRDVYLKLYKEYSDKYDAKLEENYDLASKNQQLAKDNLRLAKENLELGGKGSTLGTAPVEEHRGTHGNIKIKRKKKAAPEVKTDIQDKS